ncbi:TlpA family protein disulfide reductase [Clostridium sp.]|uniref:TlpA family protein disulfide reductase n=1 Tax=Clostridium sp. TaxID=1506 RepID=UPI003D6D2AA6
MKKIIWPLVVVLVFGISIYTVTNYNKNKAKDLNATTKENSTTNTTKPSTSSTTENATTGTDSSTVKSLENDKIPALDFKLKDLDGKEVSLSDFKGKKVFLNFWASWCPPCKGEMPDIEKLYIETKDTDLVILAVNLGENNSTAKSFMEKNKYNFTVLLDSDQSIASQYNIGGIPTTFFIDKEGNIVNSTEGGLTLEQMKDNISKL